MNLKGDLRKYNKGPTATKRLTERIVLMITPTMLYAIEKLIKKGKAANKSEFIRHVVTNHLNHINGW